MLPFSRKSGAAVVPNRSIETGLKMLDTELHTIQCPHCGEPVEIAIDPSQEVSDYIEDCSVCCRPMNLRVEVAEGSEPFVTVTSDDE